MCPIIKYEPTLCDVNADGEILVSGATAFVSIILGEEAIPSLVNAIVTSVVFTVG